MKVFVHGIFANPFTEPHNIIRLMRLEDIMGAQAFFEMADATRAEREENHRRLREDDGQDEVNDPLSLDLEAC